MLVYIGSVSKLVLSVSIEFNLLILAHLNVSVLVLELMYLLLALIMLGVAFMIIHRKDQQIYQRLNESEVPPLRSLPTETPGQPAGLAAPSRMPIDEAASPVQVSEKVLM